MSQAHSTLYLSAGALVCFDDGINDSFREDVLCSTLYIQLAAAKQFCRYRHFDQWASTYLKAMATFGLAPSVREFGTYSVAQLPLLNMRTLLRRKLGPHVPMKLLEKFITFIEHYPAPLSNESVMAIRGQFITVRTVRDPLAAGESNQVVFHVVLVGADNKIHGCVIAFTTLETINDAFFNQDFCTQKRVGNVQVGYYAAELFELRYAQFRDTFSRLLSERRGALEIALD